MSTRLPIEDSEHQRIQLQSVEVLYKEKMPGKHQFPGQQGFVNQLLARQLTGKPVLDKPFLEDFSSDAAFGGGTIQINPGGMPSPPFTVRYNKVAGFNQGKWIAIGDEEGHVSIVDGTLELPLELSSADSNVRRAAAQWVAHHNAIFDLAWFRDDERMLTGSGDQCVHLWDTASARGVGQFRGHNGSVKSVCPHGTNPNVFASGARDGALMVWDVRCPAILCNRSRTAYQAPVLAVQDAHKDVGAAKTGKGRRRKYGPFDTKHTVTSVIFLHTDYLLATSGDRDDVVKFWDMRRIGEPSLHLALPKHLPQSDYLLPTEAADCVARTPSQNVGKRQHGVTCLALNRQGTRLLVSCNSATHHLYDAQRPDAQPIASYSGHVNGSFYIRACFSPDGGHILSGSSDHKAYIWAVDEPRRPPIVLDGAAGEVTGVAWCATDPGHLTTCHDHAAVTVWALDRTRIKEPLPRQEQTVLGGSRAALRADLAITTTAFPPAVPGGLADVMHDVIMIDADEDEEELQEPGTPERTLAGGEPELVSEGGNAVGDGRRLSGGPSGGNACEDRLRYERERVPLSAMFGSSAERPSARGDRGSILRDDTQPGSSAQQLQAQGDQGLVLGDINENSCLSFSGAELWRRRSPEAAAPQASSQENRQPLADLQNRSAAAPPLHPWAARVRAAAGGRAPLGELRSGFREAASQGSREPQETDPIDFSLLQDMEHSRGLGDLSQHFEATQQGPLLDSRPRPAPLEAPSAPRVDESIYRGADAHENRGSGVGMCSPVGVQRQMNWPDLARAGGRAPLRTPPERLLRAAGALCRERLSSALPPVSPGPKPSPVYNPLESGAPPATTPERISAGGDADISASLACSEQLPSHSQQPPPAAPDQAPVPAHHSAEPDPPAETTDVRCEITAGEGTLREGVTIMPPDEGTMASAVSVWKGQKKPLCDFLLSQYRNQQPIARAAEGGTPPGGRAGALPEDGFTDESPAPPQPPPLPATPHPQKAMQEEMAAVAKRKAGNASARKQRSILDFFRTPPSE